MAQLRGHTGATDIKELNYDLSEGDQVQIVGGAFVGLEAVVTLGLIGVGAEGESASDGAAAAADAD